MFFKHPLSLSRLSFLSRLLGVMMLGVLMFGTTFTALAVDVDVCTATIEQLHGQGRFTMGGLSRFTMGGLEGADGDLSNADLPPEVIAEILGNQIKPDWLLSLLPTITSGEDFGTEQVAILVADDFPDFKRTFNSIDDLPAKWKTELNDYVNNFGGVMPSFPLDVPVLTHGQIVFQELFRQLEKIKQIYPDLPISLHRVDISELGEYRLARVRPAIVNKVNELKEQGITRFVINMSFGLIPCVDNNEGFSYEDFLAQRAARRNEALALDGGEALVDNFTLDVDGSFFNPQGSPGFEIEKRMVLYQDFGMLEYLNNILTLRDGVQNIESAKALMRKLMTSPKVSQSSKEPELLALRALLRDYMVESAQPEGARYIVVGASGNYADLIVPDAPLAPASLPEVIAAGATLGEDGPKWQFSQAAHLLLPGAWYDYTGRHTFVAGTSFAAPYMSMISGLYLTYPEACVFDGARPPLLSFGYKNMHVSPAYIGLNCLPKPVNLLKNWSFEAPGQSQQTAKQWLPLSLSGEKRVSQKAFSGKASFFFNSTPGFFSMIYQSADLTPGFEASEVLKLMANVRAKNLQPNLGSIQVVIKYTDGTPKTKAKFFAPPGSYPYTRFLGDVTIDSANIKVMNVQIRVAEGGGKFWIDDVALVKPPSAPLPLNGVIPLPAVPAATSGQIGRGTNP